MKNNNNKVPKLAHLFFRWYCKKEMYEELHGDLEEFFYERVKDKGPFKARLLYIWDVIRCCQSYAVRKPKTQNTTIMMLNNYFKTSTRSLLKNPLTSFINIFGLAVAIGICLTVYAFMDFEYKIDQFHANKGQVYLTTFYTNRDGSIERYGMSPAPLGELLSTDFPQIQKVCRVEESNVVVKYEDEVFHETLTYVDPSFLEMFTFPLGKGVNKSLNDLNSIILSHDMAIKYFGDDNVLGKDLEVIFSDSNKKVFKVAGVAEPFPKPHDLGFNFLIHFDNLDYARPTNDLSNWDQFITATFIQVNDPNQIAGLEEGMEKYKLLQNEKNSDWAIESFSLEPFVTLYANSAEIRKAIVYNGSAEGRIALPIIAIFMLGLACFNYINISIVSAAKRLKEIGVRKVIGASKNKIAFQFLFENIFVTLFALVLGLLLAVFMFLPWFIGISERSMELNFFNPELWIFLSIVLVFTGVVSGLYPAFYISKFNVIRIFRGSVHFGKKNPLTKLFLGFQLIMASILMTGAVMLTQNSNFQAKRTWGYDPNNVLYVELPDSSAFNRLEAQLIQNTNVVSVAGAIHHLGNNHTTTVIHQPDRKYEVDRLSVGPKYFETMGLQLKAGRFFKDHSENDHAAIVVNELFVENLNLSQPIGHVFEIDSMRYEVVGVVENFHLYNFYYEVLPTIFSLAETTDYKFMAIEVKSGAQPITYATLKKDWAVLFPEIPFQGDFQTRLWDNFYKDLQTQKTFSTTIATIAILLASLGLYGLVMLNVSGRVREFSIRKVFGAETKNIIKSVTNQYVLLTVISMIIGAPISYVLNKALIGMMFPETMQADYFGAFIAVFIIVSVLLTVVSTQIFRVVKSNPVDGLKME